MEAALLVPVLILGGVVAALGLFGRRARAMRGGGRAGMVGAPQTSEQLAAMGLVSTTDTETSTQASGKSVTLSPTQVPMYIETNATGSTGRYTLQGPDGTTTDFNCAPNVNKIMPIPPQWFPRGAAKIVFSVITVDGTGTIIATVWGRPLAS